MTRGNDPLEAYAVWRRTQEREARAWAALGWLAILAFGAFGAAIVWIMVSFILILFG